MKALLTIALFAFRKLMNRRRVVGLMILVLVPAGAIAMAGPGAGNPEAAFHGMTVGVFLAIVLPVVSLVNATTALGDERRDHTLGYLTLKPVSRAAIAAGLLIGATAATFLIAGVGVAALWVVGGWVTGDWTLGAFVLVATGVETIAYGAVFVPIGFAFRRATLIGLVYVFFWEAVLATAVTSIAASSLWRIGLAAYLGMIEDPGGGLLDQLGSIEPNLGTALIKAAVLAILSIMATTWFLRTRDHVVGGD